MLEGKQCFFGLTVVMQVSYGRREIERPDNLQSFPRRTLLASASNSCGPQTVRNRVALGSRWTRIPGCWREERLGEVMASLSCHNSPLNARSRIEGNRASNFTAVSGYSFYNSFTSVCNASSLPAIVSPKLSCCLQGLLDEGV